MTWGPPKSCAAFKRPVVLFHVVSLLLDKKLGHLPLNGWIDEVFLEIRDTEIDWRCRMDDVIKSVLLLSEYFVKSMRCDNVLDKGKSDSAFPRWMKV